MKVGTDSVMLGAWAEITHSATILDIGTGTGILALIAAQRNPSADITAVEIDPSAASQAGFNISRSPWSDRIHIVNTDIRSFNCPDRYDAIICNPPYFTKSLHSPDSAKNVARHDDTLGPDELLTAAERFLSADGELHLILPSEHFSNISGIASRHGLQFHRITHIYTENVRKPKRTMMSIGRKFLNTIPNSICIRNSEGTASDEYRNLVKDLYLTI